MKKVKAKAGFGYCGAYHEEEFEFNDNATKGEIEYEIWEWATQFVNIDYEIEEE